MKLLDRIANWLRRALGARDRLERELDGASGMGADAPAPTASDGGVLDPSFPASPDNPRTSSTAPAGDPQPPGGPGGGGSPAAGQGVPSDAVDFSLLRWTWGGFDGSKAKPAAGCRIGSLKVSATGLSYSWGRGGCETLGAPSATDPSCLACLFCRIGGKWRGGKFDWISTSRRTRSFENVLEGYGGWPRNAVSEADAYAFVIVSKDGRRRSNVAAVEGRA